MHTPLSMTFCSPAVHKNAARAYSDIFLVAQLRDHAITCRQFLH